MDEEIDYEIFIREYRDQKNYRLESPSANKSYKYE
ncbi:MULTISPECIES: GH-E family nuclease [unclassified Bacillus (in: firmicutes)]